MAVYQFGCTVSNHAQFGVQYIRISLQYECAIAFIQQFDCTSVMIIKSIVKSMVLCILYHLFINYSELINY